MFAFVRKLTARLTFTWRVKFLHKLYVRGSPLTYNEANYDEQLSYCLFVIGRAGHVERAAELKASSDADAIIQAQQLVTAQAIELWKRGKILVCLKPVTSEQLRLL